MALPRGARGAEGGRGRYASLVPLAPLRLADAGEVVDVGWLELEIDDVGTGDDLVLLVADEEPGRVVDDDLFRLLVDRRALLLIGDLLGLRQELVDLRIPV